jgi:hypothetical protein
MSDGTASIDTIEGQRTQYRDGRILSAAALAGDGEAHVAAWQQHQRTAHTPGIVAGLHVTPNGGKISVEPGAAIDCFGRMLLLARAWAGNFDLSKHWIVWLRHSVTLEPGQQSNLGRYRECPQIQVEEIQKESTDLQRSLERIESEGVLLSIIRDKTCDKCCRRYVGAVGSRIEAPSRRASMLLGPQSASDTRRFAIAASSETSLEDVLTWDTTSTIHFYKPTSLAAPPEKRGKTDEGRQPPIAITGSPKVNFTKADILDPCRARDFIFNDKTWPKALPAEEFLSQCDVNSVQVSTICHTQLTAILVRFLNCLLRKAGDEIRDASQPVLGAFVLDKDGNRCRLTSIGFDKCTVDSHAAPIPLTDLRPVRWLPLWQAPTNAELSRLCEYWHVLPGNHLCRLYLDSILKDTIRPLPLQKQRGLFFNETAPVDVEPTAGRIHLVEFKKEGQTHRQLRITIPDPGKENSPQRYRCSIGTSACIDPPVPEPGADIFNSQTSWPRGILSVLADKSVDIHNQLNVNSKRELSPGLILKIKPDDAAAGSATPANQPATIVKNAVDWEGAKVERDITSAPHTELTFDGALHNLTNLDIKSLEVLVTVYGDSDTVHTPRHFLLVPADPVRVLGAASTKPIKELSPLTANNKLTLPVPQEFDSKTIIVNLLVMGVNRNNEIILTEYKQNLTQP